MNVVKCRFQNCPSTFTTSEPIFPVGHPRETKFMCAKHPRREQVRMVRGEYKPKIELVDKTIFKGTDECDEEFRFQPYQFQIDGEPLDQRFGVAA